MKRLFAIFRSRLTKSPRPPFQSYGRARYITHLCARSKALAVVFARRQFSRQIRSADIVIARSDNGRKRKYGTGAGSPGGVGLL